MLDSIINCAVMAADSANRFRVRLSDVGNVWLDRAEVFGLTTMKSRSVGAADARAMSQCAVSHLQEPNRATSREGRRA